MQHQQQQEHQGQYEPVAYSRSSLQGGNLRQPDDDLEQLPLAPLLPCSYAVWYVHT